MGDEKRKSGNAAGAGRQNAQRAGRHSSPRSRAQSSAGRAARGGAASRSRTASRPASPRYSNGEILRNRIIAVVILIALVALLVNLVMCATGFSSRASEGSSAASADASAPAASETASSSDASQTGQGADSQADGSQPQASEAAAGDGVEDPWVESGRFSTGDAELDQLVKEFCDRNTNPDLDLADNAFAVYCEAVWATYVERDNNQYPTGPDWDITYAKQYVRESGGNCYEQVAFAEYVLKYFGYDDAVAMPCLVLRQSGEYGDHGLLYVTDKDGRKCLCDPAFGANGWMLDADVYSVRAMDVGQDSSEFEVANFESVVPAPWLA